MKAEAEVSASSGAVKLGLKVYRKRLGRRESLWVQVLLANVGKQRFLVTDDAFHDPWKTVRADAATLLLQVISADGGPLEYRSINHHPPPVECLSREQQDAHDEHLRQYLKVTEDLRRKSRNPSSAEFDMQVEREMRRRFPSAGPADPSFWLEPGQSTATPGGRFQDHFERYCLGNPRREPIGAFFELEGFRLQPGRQYRIRAVYNHDWPEESLEPGEVRDPWDVRVETPWIQIEAVP